VLATLLVIAGEQGSAKTVLSKMLRALVDPNVAPVRALPREERDLFIAANNGHVLAFDNLSALPPWLSDALCRLASGGSFAVRQLYTDQDEVLFDAVRPIVLNGIEDVVSRPDLADRALFLTLPYLSEARRRPEQMLWREFDRVRPHLLGGSSMRWAMAYVRCRRCASIGCHGWPISRAGPRHVKPPCGPPAPSREPMRPIARLRLQTPSMPTRWLPACAISWPSAAVGQVVPPTCCGPAPITAGTEWERDRTG
jgi:hypothetical protein